jgi:hypothetical protein
VGEEGELDQLRREVLHYENQCAKFKERIKDSKKDLEYAKSELGRWRVALEFAEGERKDGII